jgi:hypothetical protein
VACPALQYIFSHSVIKGTIFERKKVIETKMCVLIFSTTLSEIFLILRKTERDVMKYVYWSSCKVHVILVGLQYRLNFLTHFREILIEFSENQSSGGRALPCGLADGRMDGRMGRETDITKLPVTFRNFANALAVRTACSGMIRVTKCAAAYGLPRHSAKDIPSYSEFVYIIK